MEAPDNMLTHRIIGLAMRAHTRLGPGLLENAYAHCQCHELGCNARRSFSPICVSAAAASGCCLISMLYC